VREHVRLGATVRAKFPTTYNGVKTTLLGSPVVSAYVDDGLTQITAGITLAVDHDGVTGLNRVAAVLSAANGFAPFTSVDLILTAGSVGGVAIAGEVVGEYYIAGQSGAVVADGGNSATTFVTDLTESTTDYWKDAFLRITSGALINQVKKITAYDGTTKAVTVSGGFTGTPAAGVTFEIVNE
jgi:hypothetical protein